MAHFEKKQQCDLVLLVMQQSVEICSCFLPSIHFNTLIPQNTGLKAEDSASTSPFKYPRNYK